MPCEVVSLRVDFSKVAVVAMETAKMLKKWKIHDQNNQQTDTIYQWQILRYMDEYIKEK
jgi:hypothetical protein